MSSKPKAKPAPKKVAAKKKGANGYARPADVPLGTVLTDMSKKSWKIGPSIGTGGFGEIYSACSADGTAPKNHDGYQFVVKIEPHGNGPLFVEMHFYMRNAKLDEIKSFQKSNKLPSLGMPNFIGHGSHDLDGVKHRFVVMPRYGKDIWSIFLSNGRKFPQHTVSRLGIQMLDVLEYIHKCTYVHADIKGANILLGFGKTDQNQAYLVDFGLASHYTTKDYKPDPKKMHNGTIEYTSRDAHNGVPTMRGDFEILGYNLIQWMGVLLPWEADKILDRPVKVQEAKEKFIKEIDSALKKLFPSSVPEGIKNFMKYVAGLEYNETPDYKKCRKFFEADLKSLGKSNSGVLEFSAGKGKATPEKIKSKVKENVSPAKKRRTVVESDEDEEEQQSAPKRTKSKEIVPSQPKEESTRRGKKEGNILINNKISASGKSKKTYELNFELDVSLDANVVVNINRKPKTKKEDKVKVVDSDKEDEDDEVIPNSPMISPVKNIKYRKRIVQDSPGVGSPKFRTATPSTRKSPRGK